jgi:hypothetical protein
MTVPFLLEDTTGDDKGVRLQLELDEITADDAFTEEGTKFSHKHKGKYLKGVQMGVS